MGEAHPPNRQSSGGAHKDGGKGGAGRATTGGSTGSERRRALRCRTVQPSARTRAVGFKLAPRTAVPVPWAPGRMRIRCRDRSRTSFVVKLPRRRAESPGSIPTTLPAAPALRMPKSARLWGNGIRPRQPTHWRQSGASAARAEAPLRARRTSIVAGRFAARPDVTGRVERRDTACPGAHCGCTLAA
jgi:hypothetical protein